MSGRIGRILRGQLVASMIYIALGLCLICMPVETVNIVCKLFFGITIIVAGLYHVVIYAMERMNATILDLFSGGILVVLGAFLFTNPQVVIKLLPVLLGAYVLVDSIWTLKSAFRLKKRGRGSWKILMLGSLVFVGLGIAMIVNPFQTVRYTVMFAGWVLLCNGAVDVIFMIMVHFGMKELKKTVNDDAESANEAQADQESTRSVKESVKTSGTGTEVVEESAKNAGQGTQSVQRNMKTAVAGAEVGQKSIDVVGETAESIQKGANMAGEAAESVQKSTDTAGASMDFGRKSTDTAEESTKSVQKNMENSGENTDVVQEKISDEECEEQDENSSSGQKWRFLKK